MPCYVCEVVEEDTASFVNTNKHRITVAPYTAFITSRRSAFIEV